MARVQTTIASKLLGWDIRIPYVTVETVDPEVGNIVVLVIDCVLRFRPGFLRLPAVPAQSVGFDRGAAHVPSTKVLIRTRYQSHGAGRRGNSTPASVNADVAKCEQGDSTPRNLFGESTHAVSIKSDPRNRRAGGAVFVR